MPHLFLLSTHPRFFGGQSLYLLWLPWNVDPILPESSSKCDVLSEFTACEDCVVLLQSQREENLHHFHTFLFPRVHLFSGVLQLVTSVLNVGLIRDPNFDVLYLIVTLGKQKVTPWHAYAGTEERQWYSSNPFATSALESGGWSAPRLGRFLPLGNTRYPLYRGLGGQVWTGTENHSRTGIRSADRPARSKSLYFSYSEPKFSLVTKWYELFISCNTFCRYICRPTDMYITSGIRASLSSPCRWLCPVQSIHKKFETRYTCTFQSHICRYQNVHSTHTPYQLF